MEFSGRKVSLPLFVVVLAAQTEMFAAARAEPPPLHRRTLGHPPSVEPTLSGSALCSPPGSRHHWKEACSPVKEVGACLIVNKFTEIHLLLPKHYTVENTPVNIVPEKRCISVSSFLLETKFNMESLSLAAPVMEEMEGK